MKEDAILLSHKDVMVCEWSRRHHHMVHIYIYTYIDTYRYKDICVFIYLPPSVCISNMCIKYLMYVDCTVAVQTGARVVREQCGGSAELFMRVMAWGKDAGLMSAAVDESSHVY